MKYTGIAVVAALTLVAGCMPSAPKRKGDALSSVFGTNAAPLPTRTLTLAVVASENTKNTSTYLKGVAGSMTGSFAVADEASFFRAVRDALSAAFAKVVPVESPAQARAEGADLVGVVDLYAKLGTVSFQLVVADVAVTFATLDGAPISTVRGRSSHRMPYPNFSGPRWPETSSAAVSDFALALSTDAALGAFASKFKPAKPAAPAAAAPVAAVRSFRSDIETPAFAHSEDASKFALVVGVDKYASLPAAEHAARDARTVRAHLRALGYPERNIILLTDQQAGKSGLEKYLEAWLPKNVDEKSTVLFYFSGHGAPDPDKREAYLMPWDGDPKFLETTGYSVKRLYAKLSALKARRVLVAMDSCFSGAGGRSVIAQGTRPLVGRVDAGETSAGRVSALAASASDETTGADEESGHGLFTYQLLKALQTAGGRATFKQLHDALSPKVRDAARRDNRDQTPQLIGDGSATL